MSNNRLTDTELAELEALEKGATAGPWTSPWELPDDTPEEEVNFRGPDAEPVIYCGWHDGPKLFCFEVDANLATKARNAIPRLLDEVKAHRADQAAAAGELRVALPEPGSDMARLIAANRLLRAERDALRASLIADRAGWERENAQREHREDQIASILAEMGSDAEWSSHCDLGDHGIEVAAALVGRADRAKAAVVELREALDRCEAEVIGANSDPWAWRDAVKAICEQALSAPNPGQPLLDELEGLRKVEAAARRLFAVVRAADMAYNDDDECLGATVNPDGTAMRLAASALEALDQLRAGREGGK